MSEHCLRRNHLKAKARTGSGILCPMCIMAAFNEKWGMSICQSLNELATAHSDKPIAACIYGTHADETIKSLQIAGRVAAYPTPERAIRVLSQLHEYSQLRNSL